MSINFTRSAQNAYLHQKRNSNSTDSHCFDEFQFRKAGVLDIPYIFGLIQEGSLIGSFPNSLMTAKGYAFLFKDLFEDVVPLLRIFHNKTQQAKLYVFCLNNEEIGFIKIGLPTNNENFQEIELCAIDPKHRNQHYGAKMLHMFLEELPNGTKVVAHCSKYSRAMQHILIREKFCRDKRSFPLECFRLIKGANH